MVIGGRVDSNKNVFLVLAFALVLVFSFSMVSSQAWDVEGAQYENKMVLTQGSEPESMFFNDDGTIMYENNYPDGDIFQYSCSEAWEIESCSYTGVSGTLNGNSGEVEFSDDGSKLYTVHNDDIIQYSLSIPWNVGSFVEEGRLTLGFTDRGMKFGNSGNSLYVIRAGSSAPETIIQFNCSEAWNLSTCVDTGLSLTSRDQVMSDLFFSDNGSYMYEAASMDAKVFQYECSTPWEIDTCSYLGKNVSTQSASLGLNGIFISSDGSKMYEVGQDYYGAGNDAIYQYILDFPEAYVIEPKEGRDNAPTKLDLMVRVEDPQGDVLNVSFYDAFDDSLIGQRLNVESGSEVLMDWDSLSWDTDYQWYFEIDDGENVTNSGVYNFSTLENLSSCMNLIVPGEYILQGDVSTSLENCFIIKEDYVVFNGNGYSLSTSSYGGDGIYAERQRGIVVKNFENISGFSHGVFFRKGTENSVINSTMSFNEYNGVAFAETTRSNVINSTAYSNKNGFVFDFGEGQHSIINSSSYSNSMYGIHIINLETPAGSVSFEDYNRFENNVIRDNGASGIYLEDTDYNTVDNNVILSNKIGVELYSGSDNSVFYNNNFSFNDVGVEFSTSQNNTFESNFFNNTDNIYFSSVTSNTWNTSVGNLWATSLGDGFSETCTDFNFDGICDSAYDVENDARDCSSGNCDYIPIALEVGQPSGYTPLTNCTDIVSSGKYILLNDIVGIVDDCFSINSNDVELNGNGYKITGNNDSSGYGVYSSGVSNVTIKNFAGINDFNYGVLLNDVSNSFLKENFIVNNFNYGLYLSSSSNNQILDNRLKNNGVYGLYLTFGSGNVFSGNFFNNSDNSYVYLTSNNFNNSLKGNTWVNLAGDGFSQTCLDENVDGFCDTVYDVENNLEGCVSENCDNLAFSTNTILLDSCQEITESGNYVVSQDILNNGSGIDGDCFRITADNVFLNGNGHTILGDGDNTGNAIDASSVSNLSVYGFGNITGFPNYACYFYNLENLNLSNNNFYEEDGYGIRDYSSQNSLYSNNYLLNSGISISSSPYSVALNNTLEGGGISMSSENITADGNIIRNSDNGIYIDELNVVVKNNVVEFTDKGIYDSYGADNVSIINNTIRFNNYGIRLQYDGFNIVNNTIVSNNYGIFFGGSNNNDIYGNYLMNLDNYDYFSSNSNNNWDSGIYGNYWIKSEGNGFSEYCFDVDSDGICDSSYDVAYDKVGCTTSSCDSLPYSTQVGRNKATYPNYPYNGEESVFTSPILNISVFDSDGDSLDVSFYDASDDSLIGEDLNVASDSNASVIWEGLEFDTVYEWYAVLDDGSDTYRSVTWQFRTYAKNLTRCQDIKVSGEYKLTSDIYTDTSCLRIYASDVVIDGNGHSLIGDFDYDSGIFIAESALIVDNVTVKNFRNITGFNEGVYFDSSSPDYNDITNINILNNSFYDMDYGVRLSGYSSYPIEGGIIAGNYFEGNGYGLEPHTVQNFKIYSNEFFVNSVGMNMYPVYSEIFNNTFEQNNFSFYMDIRGNGYGENNLIYSNIFMDNITLKGATSSFTPTLSFPNNISWSLSGVGNYWGNMNESGYSNDCLDSNQDGFCDNSYDIEVYDTYTSTIESTGDVDVNPMSELPAWYFSLEEKAEEAKEKAESSDVDSKVSSSSGGSTGITVDAYEPSEEELVEGYRKTVVKGNEVVVSSKANKYNFKVKEVTNDLVVLSYGNREISIVGESISKIDFDNDGYYDLKISATNLNVLKGNLEFQYIDEKVVSEEIVNEEHVDKESSDEQTEFVSILKNNVWPYIVLGVVLLAVGAWFVLNRKKK